MLFASYGKALSAAVLAALGLGWLGAVLLVVLVVVLVLALVGRV